MEKEARVASLALVSDLASSGLHGPEVFDGAPACGSRTRTCSWGIIRQAPGLKPREFVIEVPKESWSADPEPAYARSPEVLKPFAQQAVKVTLKEGERQAVQVRVLKAQEAGAR